MGGWVGEVMFGWVGVCAGGQRWRGEGISTAPDCRPTPLPPPTPRPRQLAGLHEQMRERADAAAALQAQLELARGEARAHADLAQRLKAVEVQLRQERDQREAQQRRAAEAERAAVEARGAAAQQARRADEAQRAAEQEARRAREAEEACAAAEEARAAVVAAAPSSAHAEDVARQLDGLRAKLARAERHLARYGQVGGAGLVRWTASTFDVKHSTLQPMPAARCCLAPQRPLPAAPAPPAAAFHWNRQHCVPPHPPVHPPPAAGSLPGGKPGAAAAPPGPAGGAPGGRVGGWGGFSGQVEGQGSRAAAAARVLCGSKAEPQHAACLAGHSAALDPPTTQHSLNHPWQEDLERQHAEDEALLEEAVETAMQCCEVAAGIEGLTVDGLRARLYGGGSASDGAGSGDDAAAAGERGGARR